MERNVAELKESCEHHRRKFYRHHFIMLRHKSEIPGSLEADDQPDWL